MIVVYQENGWQIISQRAHGLLAGEICSHWKNENHPERWLETIIATAEHDDAYNEFDEDNVLLNENGGPVNFKMRNFEKEKCDKLISHALTKSRYITLLVARHIRFLYENEQDSVVKKYCAALQKKETGWMKEIALKAKDLTAAYSILEWCDALSLLICQGLIQPENRSIEISSGPDNKHYKLHSPERYVLNVNPWPFERDQFSVSYESRTISQLTFQNIGQFRNALMEATVDFHKFNFVKHNLAK
ncbi:DUF3891 family protein [Dyadobacter psychrotolerans]|nr:DUF3891 family protein [Dyadobacter psychrotolerans]